MAKVTRSWRSIGAGLAVLLVALLWVWPAQVLGQTRARRVLLINSFHKGHSWTDNIVAGIEAALDPTQSNIHLYVEYMDTLRFVNADQQLWYELLAEKYRYLPPDLIIVADDEAFQFVLEYRAELFPNKPVVFCGVNAFDEAMLDGHRAWVTGVVETVDMDATLDLALTLHPDTERVVIINDTTDLGRIYYPHYLELSARYGEAVRFTYYEDPYLDFMLRELRTLEASQSLILLISFSRDSTNRFYAPTEAIHLLLENTTIPIYGLWDTYLGYGLVGGKLASGSAQGEAAARIALRILSGASPASVPVATLPNRFMLDYTQLQRFGIEQGKLPGHNPKWPELPVIISAPPTFAEQYGLPLLVAAAALLIGGVIFSVQYNSLRRVRAKEMELRQSNLELEATRASLEERVEVRTRDLAKRSAQLELASAVTRDIAAIHDLDELLRSIVNLISERFGYYHVGTFLVDRTGEHAVLTAASSLGGQQMIARRYMLRRGVGLVGMALAVGEPRIALNADEDALWLDNPDLPNTRSEMALPLLMRGEVIGVLDVQSVEPEAFNEEDVRTLRTMADQLAVAIDNARLFAGTQQALEAERRAYGELEREAWQQLFRARPRWGYVSDSFGVTTLAAHTDLADEGLPEVTVPVKSREQVLGVFRARKASGEVWTPEERTLLGALLDQLGVALDGARLYHDTQRREARERAIREVSDRMQQAVDMESLTRITAEEVRRLLGGSRVFVRLAEQKAASAPGEDGSGGGNGHDN